MARALKKLKVADFVSAMNELAPTSLAQEWDNVGLLAGDPQAALKRAILCIDLMPAVVAELRRSRADLVMAYHPPLFKPVSRILAGQNDPTSAVYECLRHGIAVYSTHTALDAADGGTNDVIAEACGATVTGPIEFTDGTVERTFKLVVFVPEADVEHVASAMFDGGAGVIGDYSCCSFRHSGTGSFLGGKSTNPAIGRRGRFESVPEIRLEVIVPANRLPGVISALITSHPYEEPAYDIYPLESPPRAGIGRVADFSRPPQLGMLARRLRKQLGAPTVQIVGDRSQKVKRAVILVGAAGSLPFKAGLGAEDVVITGEIRHHDALSILRRGSQAIALNHWSSERPALAHLRRSLRELLPGLDIVLSAADGEPFSLA